MGQAGGASDGKGLVSYKFCYNYGCGWDHNLNMASITVSTETAGGGAGSSVGNGSVGYGTTTKLGTKCPICGRKTDYYSVDDMSLTFGSRGY